MKIHPELEEVTLPRCCGAITIPTNRAYVEKEESNNSNIVFVESECQVCKAKYKLGLTSFRYMIDLF